jgi:hypothetical protein
VAEVFGYSNESTILTIIMELMENGGTVAGYFVSDAFYVVSFRFMFCFVFSYPLPSFVLTQ